MIRMCENLPDLLPGPAAVTTMDRSEVDMGNAGYLGELEQMVLLAVCRLGDDAYGLGVMD